MFVVYAQGRAAVRRVRVGNTTPAAAEIVEGLNEGENLIVEGIQRIRAGTSVQAWPATAASLPFAGAAREVVRVFSSLFVDRPRLAIVIALVITIAELLALGRIPIAQLPDIVPPQVTVSAIYPGASVAVVEETVAQAIETAVNGV